jgi:starch synthase
MKIVHVASEVAPWSKTGGLGDVLGALPEALRRLGFTVAVVSPRYRGIDVSGFLARPRLTLPLGVEIGVWEKDGLFLVEHPDSFDRAGLYGEGGADYPDNARRFAILGQAALALAPDADVIHGHDWQAGPALLYARHTPMKRVFTIHNLAYMGLFSSAIVGELDFGWDQFHPGGLEFWGWASLLKAGIVLAHKITTVSPRYAAEIQTAEQGCGFEGLMQSRAADLVGILNGIDTQLWNPATDRHLPARYSAENLDGKAACKTALQRELGLPRRARTPLCGSISRLTDQKGFDLVTAVLPSLLGGDVQYVVLGAGHTALEEELEKLALRYPDKLAVRIAYDERLAHLIEAGSDLYVMPSRYEPCGLNQLYSLRYGTPPIVRATGGLDDTVEDLDGAAGTGFKFGPYTAEALGVAWRRALLAYHATRDFTALARRGMAADFSWPVSANRYAALYRTL